MREGPGLRPGENEERREFRYGLLGLALLLLSFALIGSAWHTWRLTEVPRRGAGTPELEAARLELEASAAAPWFFRLFSGEEAAQRLEAVRRRLAAQAVEERVTVLARPPADWHRVWKDLVALRALLAGLATDDPARGRIEGLLRDRHELLLGPMRDEFLDGVEGLLEPNASRITAETLRRRLDEAGLRADAPLGAEALERLRRGVVRALTPEGSSVGTLTADLDELAGFDDWFSGVFGTGPEGGAFEKRLDRLWGQAASEVTGRIRAAETIADLEIAEKLLALGSRAQRWPARGAAFHETVARLASALAAESLRRIPLSPEPLARWAREVEAALSVEVLERREYRGLSMALGGARRLARPITVILGIGRLEVEDGSLLLDVIGRADFYVKLSFHDVAPRTRVVEGDSEAVFDQDLVLAELGMDDVISFEIWDDDPELTGDERVGPHRLVTVRDLMLADAVRGSGWTLEVQPRTRDDEVEALVALRRGGD